MSVSGNGFWAIVPISSPDKHKAHFAALKKIFGELSINIDAVPSNVASLRGYSYDPDAYYNHHAIAFFKALEEPVKLLQAYKPIIGNSSESSPFDDFNETGDIMTS